MEITQAHLDQFNEDGFLVVEEFIDPGLARRASERIERLFDNQFETGVPPDIYNWEEGPNAEPLNRHLGNAWKCDYTIASIVLREETGRWCARLGGWSGARINQSDLIWKRPGSRSVVLHQDSSFNPWIVPDELVVCWVALTPSSAETGTIEYARGSHKWGAFPVGSPLVYGSADYQGDMRSAAASVSAEPEIVSVEVPAGGAAFHNGLIWHGSGDHPNATQDRRTITSACCASHARFNPEHIRDEMGGIYARYKHLCDDEMDENFFPILWTEDGHRTPFLDAYMNQGSALNG